jgi:hypothetical protein
MSILRYTCTKCGLETRAEEGQDFRACCCKVRLVVVNEDEERAAAQAVPDAE